MNLLKLITPTNLLEEKDRFFSSKTYQPAFEYAWDMQQMQDWLKRQPHYQNLASAVLEQDHQAITGQAQEIFQTDLKQEYLTQAQEMVKTTPEIKHEQVGYEALVAAFEEACALFGIDYQIEASPESGFNIRPIHNKRKLVISQHVDLQFFSLEGEVRHEMIHLIRAINGEHNGIKPSANYLPTEEGLASFFMDFVGPYRESCLFQHAAEYTATDVALKGSLRETIEHMISLGFNCDLAWQRAARHKFGFKDTSLPGDIMKPAMYFHHEMKIKELPSQERLRLLNGKISLDELDKYPEYTGKISESLLREYYQI